MKYGLAILLVSTLLPSVPQASHPVSHETCENSKLFIARNVVVWSSRSSPRAFFYKAGLAVDADGAHRAYHPNDRVRVGSFNLAGHEGNWWALVTEDEKTSGRPV